MIDIDYLDLTAWNQANNAIPTNATSIDVTLGTQGDGIWPMAYFFGVEVFEPNLVTQFEKTTPQIATPMERRFLTRLPSPIRGGANQWKYSVGDIG